MYDKFSFDFPEMLVPIFPEYLILHRRFNDITPKLEPENWRFFWKDDFLKDFAKYHFIWADFDKFTFTGFWNYN